MSFHPAKAAVLVNQAELMINDRNGLPNTPPSISHLILGQSKWDEAARRIGQVIMKLQEAKACLDGQPEREWYSLVYQHGHANVVHCAVDADGRTTYRLDHQHTFDSCECFCRGLIAGGSDVLIWCCDVAGDILKLTEHWQEGPGDLYRNSKNPPQKHYTKREDE